MSPVAASKKINFEEFVQRSSVIFEIHSFWLKKHRNIYDNYLLKMNKEYKSKPLNNSNCQQDEINEFARILDKEKKNFDIFVSSIPQFLRYEKKINIDEFRKKYLKHILS